MTGKGAIRRFFDWLDNRAIARVVRDRDAADTGERLTLAQFAERVGIALKEVRNG